MTVQAQIQDKGWTPEYILLVSSLLINRNVTMSYNVEISQLAELGDMKLEPKLSLAKSCSIIIDDEEKRVYSWHEF
jgi:hypothetical protein